MWPKPAPGGNNVFKRESTLPENYSIQMSAFLAHWFLRRIFFKYTNNLIILNNLPFNRDETF